MIKNKINKIEEEIPVVSIRCITYNHEPYIRQCLEGFVMQQTNFKFEAIVHDDASTDGTAAIVAEFAEKYPDIIKPLYETENQYSKQDGSLGRIMNAHMRGKYIAMCEGDDYWIDPLKLQKQVDFLEANSDYSGCGHEVVFSNVYEGKDVFSKCHVGAKPGRKNLLNAIQGIVCHTSSILYKSSELKIPTNLEGFIFDRVILIFLCNIGDIQVLDDCMSVYRNDNKNSVTHNILNPKDVSTYYIYIAREKRLMQSLSSTYKPLFYKLLSEYYFKIAKIQKRERRYIKMLFAVCMSLRYDWRLFYKMVNGY